LVEGKLIDLPVAHTAFVGRLGELRDIGVALDHSRLVTLTGPGGCGKTRLALEYARRVAVAPAGRRYVDGAAWCDLAPVTNPAHMLARLVAALNLPESDHTNLTERIVEALQTQECLLVLDNCEQLLAACATLAETLLARCPRLSLLATSTQPLGLLAEQVYGVPPLAVPALPARLNVQVFMALSQADAVRLFVLRAREAFPDFEAGPDNLAALVAICRRLDGLPLAIELAAARIKMLSPAQIAERLEDAFALLTRGSPADPPRHQTLRATLDWSHALLPASEQALLRRLAIFGGSFELEAVEAVCGGHAPVGPWLDQLTDLAERSFVSIWRHDPDNVRYALLETIRQYARERLEAAGEYAPTAARLLDWCMGLAQQLQPELEGAAQAAGLARLEREHDNLRVALHWALAAGHAEQGLRLAASLERFWLTHGHPSEGRDWLNQLLSPSGAPVDLAVRARALSVAGLLAYRQSDSDQAEAYFRECGRIWEALHDAPGIARTLNRLGDVLAQRGQTAAALQTLHDSLRLCRHLGDERGIASVLISLGAVVSAQGDYAPATAFYEEALRLCRKLDDQWMIAVLLNNLGALAVWQADLDGATRLMYETLAMRQALHDQNGVAIALTNLTEVSLQQRQWPQARALARESLALYRLVNNQIGLAKAFVQLAQVDHHQGSGQRATRLLGIVEKLQAAIGPLAREDQSAFDEIAAEVHAQLDEHTWERLRLEGRALPLADAMAYALSAEADAAPDQVECHVTTFGHSAVVLAGTPLSEADWRYAKARELFFYLLAQPRATKAQLGLALYPDASPAQIRSRLHRVLHHARRALRSPDWILFDGQAYAINRQRSYWYDAEQFEQRVHRAQAALGESPRQTALAIHLLQEAGPLYTGDFLPELDAEWCLFRREELRRLALAALLQLGGLLLDQGHTADAIAVYERVLELDGYLEAAHRGLMRGFARQGEAARARQHFQQLRQVLRAELGTEPSPETEQLDAQIGAGQAT
jgi:predicted ATPase/two-component SAPR family response regulator